MSSRPGFRSPSPIRGHGTTRAPPWWSRSRPRTGLIGWGECYGPARMTAAVVESVAPWLIGEDPLRTDYLWQKIYARLARPRPEGRRDPGAERHRHRAVGHQGKAFRRSRAPAAGRSDSQRGAGLRDRALPAQIRRSAPLSRRGGRRLCRGRFQGGEAEGRLRRGGGCRRDARRARGDRARCRTDGRCQPRLRCGRGDPARPDDRAHTTSDGSRSRCRRRMWRAIAR